jgi:hypothetical protein
MENLAVSYFVYFFIAECTYTVYECEMAQLRYPYTFGAMVHRFPLRYYIGGNNGFSRHLLY